LPSKIVIFLVLLLLPLTELLALVELGGTYSYQRQRFGDGRQNSVTSKTYHGSMAIYLFNLTAIELNYSETEDIAEQNDNIPITDTTISVTKNSNIVRTTVYGIGIKQALASRKAFLRPTISFGYAKMFAVDGTDYTFYDSSNGNTILYRADRDRKRDESVFAEFALQIRLSSRFALKGSVKTVYPAFKGGLAKDNMKYLAGFTWYL
jgi:hypothetical protein